MTARRRTAVGLLTVLAASFALLLAWGGGRPVRGQDADGDAGQVQRLQSGAELYVQNCASCHGPDGQGGANGPSLVGVGPANLDFQMWTGRMPVAAPNEPR